MTLLSAGIINDGVAIPSNGLRGFWPLTPETITATAALDKSGNSRNLPRHGVTETAEGAQFDGNDDYLGAVNLGTVSGAAATASLWVDLFRNAETPFSVTDGSTTEAFVLYDNDSIFIDGSFIATAMASVNSDTHIIFKTDGSNWEIKLDTVVHDSGTFTSSFSGDLWLLVGAEADALQGGSPSQFYQGTMHDVAFYDRYTTDAEDAQLYNNPST